MKNMESLGYVHKYQTQFCISKNSKFLKNFVSNFCVLEL